MLGSSSWISFDCDSSSLGAFSCSLESAAAWAKASSGLAAACSVGVVTAESGPGLSEGVGDPGV